MRDKFISKSQNNFSYIILKNSSDSVEFAKRLRALSKHAQDQHAWEVENEKGETVTEYCEFHSQMVCSCNQCENKADFHCEGKTYSTTYKLTCPAIYIIIHYLYHTVCCYYLTYH